MLPWVAYQEISQEYRLIFLIDIIETLEAQGLDREKSQLYDYIDVDALEQLLYSSNGNGSTVCGRRNPVHGDTGGCRRSR